MQIVSPFSLPPGDGGVVAVAFSSFSLPLGDCSDTLATHDHGRSLFLLSRSGCVEVV